MAGSTSSYGHLGRHPLYVADKLVETRQIDGCHAWFVWLAAAYFRVGGHDGHVTSLSHLQQ